jgi:hypothetical protein
MFMMIDTTTTASIAGLARHGDRFGDVDGNSAKPQLARLLAELKAADDKTSRKIESCRQEIGTAQAQCLVSSTPG